LLYVYIGCLSFGILYAIISALLSDGDVDYGEADLTGLEGEAASDVSDMPSPFSPLVIVSAISTFGAVGIIGKTGFKMGDIASAILSLSLAGIMGAAIFFGIVKVMYSSQSDSTFSLEELVGSEAEVIITIPGNGLGLIALVVNGTRYNLPAKSLDGKSIERSSIVKIRKLKGNAAVVTQKLTLGQLEVSGMSSEVSGEISKGMSKDTDITKDLSSYASNSEININADVVKSDEDTYITEEKSKDLKINTESTRKQENNKI